MPPTSGDSIAYAQQVVALLWPSPATSRLVVTVGRAGPDTDREWVVFPTAGRPRTLIPTGLDGAESMLERQQGDHRLSGRLARSAVTWAARMGLLGWLPLTRLRVTPAGESIESLLGGILGRPVVVGILLGTWRANRKPVLRVFDRAGATVGFVKIGHNELTRDLVRREALNLRNVGASPCRHLVAPRLIHHQQWRGLEVLVMSALNHPMDAEAPPGGMPLEAMRELSTLGGVRECALSASGYLDRLHNRLDQCVDNPAAGRLAQLLRQVQAHHGDDVVAFGSWHGDWAAWNMAWDGGRVQLWDWERFEQQVPLGFDALHFRMQSVGHDRRSEHGGAPAVFAEAPELLGRVEVPAHRVAVTILLYLAEVCVRYVVAAQGDVGAPLRPRSDWMLGLLETQVEGIGTVSTQEGRPA